MIRQVSTAWTAWAMLLSGIAFAQDAGKVERGKAVFAEQKCAICHSVGGVGNPKGPLEESVAS